MGKQKNKDVSRLDQAVRNGHITRREAQIIMSYPPAHERLENARVRVRRALNVAKAVARDKARERRPHHTRYNPKIIEAIETRIGKSKMILEPMAGTLERLSCLEKPERGYHLVWGVELEPEWVEENPHPRFIQGDARNLPFEDEFFDVIVVSPSYGNRDSDRTGEWWDNSDRKTYAGALGRNVSEASMCLPYGPEYKKLHGLAWCEAVRVLKPDGLFVINLKNFIARHAIVPMSQFHRNMLRSLGLEEFDDTSIPTRGRPSGENADVRAEQVEKIYLYTRPARSLQQAAYVRNEIETGRLSL